ncbi:MAG: Rpn family recombination-promoting nuclease/putative transposase [Prevotellaceae bacterium]|jgi:predicted transposase/invertase (TIGR01784 family)|nr:Rpn family recombination-promoting nuclease/putative transposase [Prevotellaceae bacterium]
MAQKNNRNKKEDKEEKEFPTPQIFMNIKTDYGFKTVFGNKVLLIAFVNALLILPEPIEDVEYLPLEQLGHSEKTRKAIYDVYVKTTNGQHFIIEMQIVEQSYFIDRMLFYASHSTISQAPKGKITITDAQGKTVKKKWNYKIDGVYMITILDFVMFKEDIAKDIIIEYVEMVRRIAKLVFTEKYQSVIIELPKFTKTLEELSDNVIEIWLYSIIHMEEMTSCPEVAAKDAVLKELYETARLNKLTKEDMETYRKSVLEYDDVRSAMDCAEERGRVEGRIEGRVEGRIEERNKFVNYLYNHKIMSLKQIAEFTGLTEKEVFEIIDTP